jgi:uncharacterized surface protein with fasciclin (FAS1) repeats
MTNYLTRTLALCAVVALAALLTVPAQAQNKTKSDGEKADIVQTAQNAEGFETLVAALKAADLAKVLKGEGPFTVFAPTDEAFAALPEGTLETLLKPKNKSILQSILKYHVVSGTANAKAVTGMKEAETLEGSKIGIETKEGTVTLSGKNNATVTKTDLMASNGVIHVVDGVLMPPERTTMKEKQ